MAETLISGRRVASRVPRDDLSQPFCQARGVLKKELTQYLRTRRTIRRSGKASRKGHGKGQIEDMISIRERPASVEDRAVPGHWEGDLIAGSRNTYIATLVERHPRYVMLAKVPNKKTETVVNALIEQAHPLPTELYKSLTWDRGLEMADHKRFTLATNIAVYWTRLLGNSTSGHARRWSSQLQEKHLMHVLHRPIEPASFIVHCCISPRSGNRPGETRIIPNHSLTCPSRGDFRCLPNLRDFKDFPKFSTCWPHEHVRNGWRRRTRRCAPWAHPGRARSDRQSA